MTRPPLKLIEWEDAYNGNHSWTPLNEIPDHPPAHIVTTVGFELRRNAERVTLTMTLGPDDADDERSALDLFTIPIGMIRKEKVLK